ncbi:gamma-glutamyltransferase [Belnapia sp. T6]|uniref:Gamma-glutamyltransferase n=1 Tax=Belnapia mucosa TaxID=2804532 RepID=A0ABS1V5X8_9PROT|nr:gamma-glutamyltransferase [Belnapia mucosa]MBL6457093.1 gamma-glutamyltransferase [Belnapia mucosa]
MTSSAETRTNGLRMAASPGRDARRRGGAGGRALLLAAALALPGCETTSNLVSGIIGSGPPAGAPGFVRGFLGGVATEDPAAALAARNVLAAGGTATDAAVAAGFVLSVTLPSRVGLGGGGACLVFDPQKAATEAVLFLPGPRSATPAGADRPAAVPLLARGLFGLHTRNPGRPFEELMAPAEQLARFGTEVSRGLAADLAAVSGPLLADPGARAAFAGPNGAPRQAGETMTQPELAATLGQLRIAGVGDLHQGTLARRLEVVSRAAGGNLTLEELRAALPNLVPPLELPSRNGDRIAFLPPPADGGLAAAAAFTALQGGASLEQAHRRGLAAVTAWRQRGGDPKAILAADLPAATPGPLGASAGLVIFDRSGNGVSCAFTMNNLFGTGRMAPGLGFLLAPAANIGQVRAPLLSAAIAYNPNVKGYRLGVAASGQDYAPIGVAGTAALQLLRSQAPLAAIEAGSVGAARVQLGACVNYLPGYPDRCTILSDPRGTGVALGAIDQ